MALAILAPNGRWSALEQIGVPAANGFVFTYDNQTRDLKPTYQDPAEQTFNENPIRLDGSGSANIYWDINVTYYTIEVYAANKSSPFIPGELIYSQDNYPATGGSGGGDIVVNSLPNNLVRNAQFTIWGSNNYLKPPIQTPEDVYTRLGTNEVICDDFIFERNNTNATIKISRGQFDAGQTDVEENPVNYLHYECDNVGAAGETFKAVSQTYQSAETLSGAESSVAISAKSDTNSTITIYFTQNFGTGGTPSDEVITTLLSGTLNSAWDKYQATVTIPSVAGKTFGTNGDSYTKLSVGMPLNAISSVDIDNLQLHPQNTLPPFPYETINDQIKRLDSVVNEGTFQTGDHVLSLKSDDRQGWLLCDDMTIGNFYSSATHIGNQYLQLFLALWNEIPNYYAPIYNSSGELTTRGSSAIDDWNADKQINLTRTLGRSLGAKGQPTFFQEFTAAVTPLTFTASTTTEQLTVSSTATMPTGQAISFSSTGTLPAPLVAGTIYFSIHLTATTIRVATTQALALSGSFLNLTTTGTGTHSVYSNDELTVGDALSYYTTTPIVFTTTGGTLPAPLSLATTYYAIYADSTNFKVATTFLNALSGISIPFTSAGSGINVATITYTQSLANGQTIGEYAHWPTQQETALHSHSYHDYTLQNAGTSSGGSAQARVAANTAQNDYGGMSSFNITQPSFYTNCFLKL